MSVSTGSSRVYREGVIAPPRPRKRASTALIRKARKLEWSIVAIVFVLAATFSAAVSVLLD
jgi:hypothetical protein